jgi:hypothetical protein
MRIETFAALVEQIQALPAGPRKTCLALECNAVAESFKGLVDDVQTATKAYAPAKAAQTTKKAIKCRQKS